MKTQKYIEYARKVVSKNLVRADLSSDQRMLLAGMSIALQWVCDDGGTTLQRLVDGEALDPGITVDDVSRTSMEFIKDGKLPSQEMTELQVDADK